MGKQLWAKKYVANPPFTLLEWICSFNTVFLSFLKRERERTVNVPWTYRERDFAIVSDRLPCTVWSLHTVQRPWPFTVPDRSPFLTVLDRSWPFLTVLDRSWPFLTVLDRSWPFLTVPERFRPIYERFRSFSTVLWVFSVICDLYGRFDHNNIHVNKLSSYNVL